MSWRNPRVGDRVKFKDEPPTHQSFRNQEGIVTDIIEDGEIAFVRLDDPSEELGVGCNWDELEIIF